MRVFCLFSFLLWLLLLSGVSAQDTQVSVPVEMLRNTELNTRPLRVEAEVVKHIYYLPSPDESQSRVDLRREQGRVVEDVVFWRGPQGHRLEKLEKTMKGDQQGLITQDVSVFQGSTYRRLSREVKDASRPVGIVGDIDSNASDITRYIFGRPHLPNWDVLSDPQFTTAKREGEVWIVTSDSSQHDQFMYEIRINPMKGGFVEAAEARTLDGRRVWSMESEIAAWGSGSNWFPRTHRYYVYGPHSGEKRLEWEARIDSVDFDIELDSSMFELPFPNDAVVYDARLGKWLDPTSEMLQIQDEVLTEITDWFGMQTVSACSKSFHPRAGDGREGRHHQWSQGQEADRPGGVGQRGLSGRSG